MPALNAGTPPDSTDTPLFPKTHFLMDASETNATEHYEDAATPNGNATDAQMPDGESPDDARVIELVGFLVQGIVDHPDEVEVEEFYDDIGLVYGVRVHPDDVGRVIGREGRVAGALRNLAKAAATKIGAHVTVEILTDDEA